MNETFQSTDPRIVLLSSKKLIGNHLTMCFANYNIASLWKSFMPRRKEITNNTTNNLFSVSVYQAGHFVNFDPANEFEKWAALEVTDFENVPAAMETFFLPGGLYAVFDYKGSNTDHSIFEYIFTKWLPGSDYLLDNRPHFEILGEKYKNNDPASEEEIWIPIKKI